MSGYIYMSEEGFAKLERELSHLRSVERPSIVQAIADARDKGDLSENAEYHAAKEAQVMLENKISQLEHTLSRARVIDPSELDLTKVQIQTRVRLRNLNLKKEMEYRIVSDAEADIAEKKISIGSPVAQALLGKKVGEIVEVQVPSGLQRFEILEIGI